MRPCSTRVHRLDLVLKNDLHAPLRFKIVLWASVRWLFYITSLVVKPWREDRLTNLRPEQKRVEVIHHVVFVLILDNSYSNFEYPLRYGNNSAIIAEVYKEMQSLQGVKTQRKLIHRRTQEKHVSLQHVPSSSTVLTRHRCQPKEVSTCPCLHPPLLWDSPSLLGENRALIYALLPSSICLGSTPSNAQFKKELIKVQQPQPHPFLRIGK